MPDEDEDVTATLSRMEGRIESLEQRLARQAPMTPGRAAAEARQAMARGYRVAADERAAAKAAAAERAATEDGGAE